MTRPTNDYSPLIERLRTDIKCGGKIGESSAIRLLDVIDQMASEIHNLRNRLERVETR